MSEMWHRFQWSWVAERWANHWDDFGPVERLRYWRLARICGALGHRWEVTKMYEEDYFYGSYRECKRCEKFEHLEGEL